MIFAKKINSAAVMAGEFSLVTCNTKLAPSRPHIAIPSKIYESYSSELFAKLFMGHPPELRAGSGLAPEVYSIPKGLFTLPIGSVFKDHLSD